jgi:anti-sigma-K factor RskA
MNHEEAYNLLESYSLGILDAEEAQLVENHLATGCIECTEQLRQLGELNARLADGLTQKKPSPAVKERLMARIQSESEAEKGSSFDKRPWVSWVITSIAAAAVLLLVYRTVLLQDEIDRLSPLLAETEDVTDLLSSPGMQFVDLHGVEPNAQAFGKVVVDPVAGNAVVYMYKLPVTPEGMEYQLWVMRDGKPTSAGVFSVSEDGYGKLMLNDKVDPAELPSFLVTIEPEGGENVPTGMMYLTSP